MNRYKLLLWCIGGLFSWASCSDADMPDSSSESTEDMYKLEFSVWARSSKPNGELNEETLLKSLYVYAFDNTHLHPDYFVDRVINEQEAYKVSMMISGTGEKRFYFFANPPRYIREVLTEDCPEGTLKTLGIYMRKPIKKMSELPQSADGISNPGNTGFPMANQMVAYANLGDKERELYLSSEPEKAGGRITNIPVFRSLGKISVTAWRKFESQEILKVTGLYIFNYGCDGYFSPIWDMRENGYWGKPSKGVAAWNPDLKMDLAEMVKKETQVGVDAVSVLEKETEILPQYSNKDNTLLLSSFYLCQNSYGKAMDGDTQEGVSDLLGNRTARMVVYLSDGRISEVELPYLKRNDHLNIRLAITANTLQVEFQKWNQSDVLPDWDDGVHHPGTLDYPATNK